MLPEALPGHFVYTDKQILILGFLPDRSVVFVDENGRLGFSDEDSVVTDWRYDADNDDWRDRSAVTGPVASEEA